MGTEMTQATGRSSSPDMFDIIGSLALKFAALSWIVTNAAVVWRYGYYLKSGEWLRSACDVHAFMNRPDIPKWMMDIMIKDGATIAPHPSCAVDTSWIGFNELIGNLLNQQDMIAALGVAMIPALIITYYWLD